MINWSVQKGATSQSNNLHTELKKKSSVSRIQFFRWSLLTAYFLLLAFTITENDKTFITSAISRGNTGNILGETTIDRPDNLPMKNDSAQSDPAISATSVIAIDPTTFYVFYEKNADEQRAMASTTKIMTALVTLREFSPTYVLKIDNLDVAVGGSSMYLIPGEQLLLQDMIKGLLIPSGNDSALTFSNEFSQRGKDLIAEMNDYAKALGMKNTKFKNSSGLDEEGHYSTARDLAILGAYAIRDYTIRSATGMEEDTVYSLDGVHGHYLKSTNELLGELDGVNGLKTGYTENAGECLITSVERDGKKIIVVVLNSPDRFEESKSLIEWVYANYHW